MTNTTAPAVAAVLRRGGLNPVAPADHAREGVKVKRSLDSVRVTIDVDNGAQAKRLAGDARQILGEAGYAMTELSTDPVVAFYVTGRVR